MSKNTIIIKKLEFVKGNTKYGKYTKVHTMKLITSICC